MKIEVNIEKKHFYALVTIVAAIGIILFVYAAAGGQEIPDPGHHLEDVRGASLYPFPQDGFFWIFYPDDKFIGEYVGTEKALGIDGAGNVYIGTTDPAQSPKPSLNLRGNLNVDGNVDVKGGVILKNDILAQYNNCNWVNQVVAHDDKILGIEWEAVECPAGCYLKGIRTGEDPVWYEQHQIKCCCLPISQVI
ncbi:MAG: hypothetical protein ABII01_07475 [Candidatus Woesearchaeota archaeon]